MCGAPLGHVSASACMLIAIEEDTAEARAALLGSPAGRLLLHALMLEGAHAACTCTWGLHIIFLYI